MILNPLFINMNKSKVFSLASNFLWHDWNLSLLIIIKHIPIVDYAMFCFVTMEKLCILVIQIKDNRMKVTPVRAWIFLMFTENKFIPIKYNFVHNVYTACASWVFNNPCSEISVSSDSNFRTIRLDDKYGIQYNSCDIPETLRKLSSIIQFPKNTSDEPPTTW